MYLFLCLKSFLKGHCWLSTLGSLFRSLYIFLRLANQWLASKFEYSFRCRLGCRFGSCCRLGSCWLLCSSRLGCRLCHFATGSCSGWLLLGLLLSFLLCRLAYIYEMQYIRQIIKTY